MGERRERNGDRRRAKPDERLRALEDRRVRGLSLERRRDELWDLRAKRAEARMPKCRYVKVFECASGASVVFQGVWGIFGGICVFKL